MHVKKAQTAYKEGHMRRFAAAGGGDEDSQIRAKETGGDRLRSGLSGQVGQIVVACEVAVEGGARCRGCNARDALAQIREGGDREEAAGHEWRDRLERTRAVLASGGGHPPSLRIRIESIGD